MTLVEGRPGATGAGGAPRHGRGRAPAGYPMPVARALPGPCTTALLRQGSRQQLCGVVVNVRPNVARSDYERLEAILTNCQRHGVAGQNRDGHADFRGHLRGRVAWVNSLAPARGAKLQELFEGIDWEGLATAESPGRQAPIEYPDKTS